MLVEEERGENARECKLQGRQWSGKKSGLVDADTLCFWFLKRHFNISSSTTTRCQLDGWNVPLNVPCKCLVNV